MHDEGRWGKRGWYFGGGQPQSQSTLQSISQPIKHKISNRPLRQSINQSINQSSNQPVNASTVRTDNQPVNKTANQPQSVPTNKLRVLIGKISPHECINQSTTESCRHGRRLTCSQAESLTSANKSTYQHNANTYCITNNTPLNRFLLLEHERKALTSCSPKNKSLKNTTRDSYAAKNTYLLIV